MITLFEAVLASVFVFILTYFVLRLELAFSVVLSALASATAPASTMMTIRQTGAKGDFVDTLLQVVAPTTWWGWCCTGRDLRRAGEPRRQRRMLV